MIEIVDFKIEHASAFKELNYRWINKFFEIEESDRKMLENPQAYIIDNGGAVLIALENDQVVGTCALVKMKEANTYELAKMAVDENFQNKGIGYLLGQATIEKARSMDAVKLFLETNGKLGCH